MVGIIYLAVNRFGAWSELRENLFSVGMLTLDVAILWRLVVTTLPKQIAPYALLTMSALTFSMAHSETLIWAGAGFGWIIPDTLALFGLYLITKRSPRVSDYALGFISCAAAAVSGAFGLSALLVGFLVLLVRSPFKAWAVVAWGIGAAVVFALYMHGLEHLSKPFVVKPSEVFTVYPHYVLAYLGSALGGWQGLEMSQSIGAFGLVVFLVACVYYGRLRLRGEDAAAYLPWLALSAFVIPNALLTGYGRTALGLVQAMSSRYTTISTNLWYGDIALGVLLGIAVLKKTGAIRKQAFIALSVALVLGFIYCFVEIQIVGFGSTLALRTRMDQGMLAVRSLPYASDEQLASLYPDTNYIRDCVLKLKQAGIAIR